MLKIFRRLFTKRLFSSTNFVSNVIEESFDFVPRSIFERIKSSTSEIDPALYDEKQVALSGKEIEIGLKWKLLARPTDSSHSSMNNTEINSLNNAGLFSANEWIQLLTHPSYYNGIAVNNSKFAMLGEPLVGFFIATDNNVFTELDSSVQESNTELDEKSSSNENAQAEPSYPQPIDTESLKFISNMGHLASSIHIAHRMRYMGITGIIRCHREHKSKEPSLGIIQSVFHAIVGGIYQKAGIERAREFVISTLTYQMPKK